MVQTMKTLIQAAAIVAAVLVGGCTTVEISSPGTLKGIDVKGAGGKAEQAIMLENEGYYFFFTWPVVTGSLDWDAGAKGIENSIKLFSNELAADKMANVLYRYADSRNCDLVDVVINNKDVDGVGLFSLLDWFNTIFAYRVVTYSAVLCPRK